MISSKKVFKVPRNWKNFAAIKRKRISVSRNEGSDGSSTSRLPQKGHFFVYSVDRKRYLIPLVYLNKQIFRELLKLSAEEFGLQIDGPITLPCDGSFMDYIVMLVEQGAGENLEKALLLWVATSCCSSRSLFHEEQTNQQVFVSRY